MNRRSFSAGLWLAGVALLSMTAPAVGAASAEVSFVLVEGAALATWAHAGDADVRAAIAVHPQLGEDFVWVRRGDERLALTGAAPLARVRGLRDEQTRLTRERLALGTAGAGLSAGQTRIAGLRQQLDVERQELARAQDEVNDRRAWLRAQRIQKDFDLSNDPAKSRPSLSDLAIRLGMREQAIRAEEARCTQKQREIEGRERDLDRAQHQLGLDHRALVRRIRDLGAQEEELRGRIPGEIARLADEGVAQGTARVLPDPH